MTEEIVPAERLTSSQKVRNAIDRAEGFADDPTAPMFVRMVANTLGAMRGQIDGLLPQTDEELDELLEKGARWMESLKSDA
jgi:hypothetical protein